MGALYSAMVIVRTEKNTVARKICYYKNKSIKGLSDKVIDTSRYRFRGSGTAYCHNCKQAGLFSKVIYCLSTDTNTPDGKDI